MSHAPPSGEPDSGPASVDSRRAESTTRGVRRATANVASLLTSNVVNRATSFIVYVIVGRFRGAEQLGRLVLAITLLMFFSRVVMLGLQTLAAREIARDRSKTASYLVHTLVIATGASLIGYAAAFAFVEVLGYPPATSRTILILFLGLGAYSISRVTESILLAWHKASYVAFINVPVNVVQTVVAFVLLQRGYSVDAVALSIVAAYFAFAIIQAITIARMARPLSPRVDLQTMKDMVKMGSTFLGIETLTALSSSISIIFISVFLSETEVGVYAAARQLLVPLNLVASSVGLGLFPTMVQRYRSGVEGLQRLTGRVTELMVAVVLPAVAGLALLAGPILEFIYGDDSFEQSVLVLQILAWTGLSGGIVAVFGQALWAVGKEKTTLRIVAINALVLVTAGLLFIPLFGVVGAAIAATVVGAINTAQHYLPVARLFGGFPLAPSLWRPGLAVFALVVVVFLTGGVPVVPRILLAAGVYVSTLVVVFIVSSGGWSGFRDRWL